MMDGGRRHPLMTMMVRADHRLLWVVWGWFDVDAVVDQMGYVELVLDRCV